MGVFLSKFIVYFLAPLITILLVVMKLNGWQDFAKQHQNWSFFLNGLTILGTAFIYYFSIFSPHKKYEKTKKRKWELMEKQAVKLNDDYNNEYQFSINIMLAHWTPVYLIEPRKGNREKKKVSFNGKIFAPARRLTGQAVHPNFRMSVNQGVCGDAFKEGKETSKHFVKSAVLLPELQQDKDYNFTKEQESYISGLIIVASCPLVINEKEGDVEKWKRIGVLNVESRVLGSVALVLEPDSKEKFHEKIASLGNIFITLHV